MPNAFLAPLSATVSQESIEATRAAMADTTRAIAYGSGVAGYELEVPAKVIVPVITPLVNMIPRRQGNGVDIVHWKAVTSFDTGRSWGALTSNGVPPSVTYNFVPMQNLLATISLSNAVDFEAQWTGQSLEGDVRARRVAELLYALKMVEEKWLICASQLVMTPPAPLLATTATGGTVAAATYWVQITAINANGETLASSASSITTTGSTSTITITIFTVPNATGYNVYVGSGAALPATSAMWKQTGQSGNTNAAQPGYGVAVALNGGGSIPSGETQGPVVTPPAITAPPATSGVALSTVVANTAKTFIDGSNNIKMFDGLIAQALNNTSGANGAPLQAIVAQPAALTGLLALADIDNVLASIYAGAAGDPDFLVCHPIIHKRLTALYLAAGYIKDNVDASQPVQHGQLTANYRVTHYLNMSTGKELPIIPDRYCPVDTILLLPMTIPYPVAEVSNAIEIETAREYWGVDFAVTGSSYPFADYVMETLKVYFLGGLGVIRGITPAA